MVRATTGHWKVYDNGVLLGDERHAIGLAKPPQLHQDVKETIMSDPVNPERLLEEAE